jgi:hypothetical protein
MSELEKFLAERETALIRDIERLRFENSFLKKFLDHLTGKNPKKEIRFRP